MRATPFPFILLLTTLHAQADFSFTTTRKTTAGASVAGNENQPSKYHFKGQKMKMETGDHAVIFDFGAETISTLDHNQKTISVRSFSATGPADKPFEGPLKIDIKETGQKKTINGYEASQVTLTTDLDSAELQQMGSKVQMEMDVWLSRDVPGSDELRKFYQKNKGRFPWIAMSEALNRGGNPTLQACLAGLQRRIAEMNGVQALQLVRVKPAAAPARPQLSAADSTRIRFAIAELDAKVQKGGPEAVYATDQLARLKALVGDDLLAGGGPAGSLFEITIESTGFSAASIPDSVFAIPADYRKIDLK